MSADLDVELLLQQWLDADALPVALLILIGIEAVALVLWRRRTGRGPLPSLALPFLGAGAGFAAALFFHRRLDGATGFGLALLGALAMHLWHLRSLARVSRASHE